MFETIEPIVTLIRLRKCYIKFKKYVPLYFRNTKIPKRLKSEMNGNSITLLVNAN